MPLFAARGFTLIELMVVVSIMSVLSVLLLATIQKSRQASDKVACASNLKQTYCGIMAYVSDNNQDMPIGYNSITRLSWRDVLMRGGYLGGEPTSDLRKYNPVLGCPAQRKAKNAPSYVSTYGLNGDLLGLVNRTAKLVNLANLPQKMLLADGAYTGGVDFNADLWAGTAPLVVHGIYVNILFFDGHVESVKAQDIPTNPSATFWTGQ